MINLEDIIICSDDHLLVIDKPAGLLSLPDGYDATLPHLRSVLEPDFGRLWIVHRLDRETSGVILLARNADAHRTLNAQFANRHISKTYHALVTKNPRWDEKLVNLPLRTNVGHRNRTAVDHRRGKSASTHLRVLEQFNDYALVEAAPKTGRRHQIRAHLYSQGHPVLSDPLYGTGEISPLIDRLALHAVSLTIQHPHTGENKSFEAPYPPDFRAALRRLLPKRV
ncbi:MAG: RluA family pseudouridine synthase [Chloroflexota bacterium]|nr:RluA family pseudouridine synthase [Chloroflexota bacterium]